MKKFKIAILILVLMMILNVTAYADIVVLLPDVTPTPTPTPTIVMDRKQFKGVWISSVFNIDFPSKTKLSVQEMKQEMQDIVDNCAKNGINNIFFQVRPTADALYKSKYFPWSDVLTGKQGVAPKENFDPLRHLVTIAKGSNIDVHAWLNPYRITTKGKVKASKKAALKKLAKNSPARKNPSWVIKHTDGALYFDPGNPKVQNYIAKGALEIAKNYDVKSIHIDDYFYPDKKFNDAKTYKKYKGNFKTKASFRRNSVTSLIKKINASVKKANTNCEFGVSPAGIWANYEHNKIGSKTHGNETYYNNYADTRKWMLENLIDYIVPQIYWEIGYKVADYATITKWWVDLAEKSSVRLYIGLPLYRLQKKSSSKAWRTSATIKKQINYNKNFQEIEGEVFFGYDRIAKNILKCNNVIINN